MPAYPVGARQDMDGAALKLVVDSRSSQRLLLVDRQGEKARFPKSEPFTAVGLRHFLGMPLIIGDQLIGTLGFNREIRPYSRKDLDKAERLGNLVTGAFADYKQQQYRDLAEREISKNKATLEAEPRSAESLVHL